MSGSPFDHVADISRWLAHAGICHLELSGPDGRLSLTRGVLTGGADAATQPGEPEAAAADEIVRSPGMGVLHLAHPLREEPLAPLGSRVRAGQALAILRAGAVLTPVVAPTEGIVAQILGEEGRLCGYGDPLVSLSPIEDEE